MSEHTPSSGGGSLGYTLGIVTVAALGGFLFGFDTAVINGAVPVLGDMYLDRELSFNAGLPQTQVWMQAVTGPAVALALLGAALGAFAAGPISNKIGRKKSMVVAAILFLVSAIGSGLPFTIVDFTFWRVLGGMAFGAASVIAPAYIAEVSPAALRGRLGSMQQLAIVIGIFVALVSNLAIVQLTEGNSAASEWLFGAQAWQWMFWIEAIPAVAYAVFALLIPESPRFLVTQNRDAEARGVLARVLGESESDAKIVQIHESLNQEHKPRMSDILAPRGVFKKIVWLGIGLSVFQQFVGINVVFYYSNLLWQSVGFGEGAALWLTVIGGGTNVLTTFIAIALVDKLGRKPLLVAGSGLMMTSLATMAITFSVAPTVTNPGTLNLSESSPAVFEIAADITQGDGTTSVMIPLSVPEPTESGTPVESLELAFGEFVPDSTQPAEIVLSGLPEGVRVGAADLLDDGSYSLRTTVQPSLTGDNAILGNIALIALNLFIIGFGASWGPIVWVMLGEMFSNQIRGAGLAVAAAAQWAANFLISVSFPFMAGLSLAFAYGFYAVSALLSLLFVMSLIPETKGRELEAMNELEGS